MTKSTVAALTSLSAIALERARVLQTEFRAQADRRTEQLRAYGSRRFGASVQDPADRKSRAASAGLLALGGLSGLQTECVAIIDQQARKLDDLASRLLRSAGLEGEEFKPRRKALLFSTMAHAAIGDQEAGTVETAADPGNRSRWRNSCVGGRRTDPDRHCSTPGQRVQVFQPGLSDRSVIRG